MSFSHDPSTDEGLLRSLIDDTDSTDYVFEDNELTNILSLNSSDVWAAAADCSRRLAAKYAKEAENIKLGKGDIEIKRSKAKYYMQLAGNFQSRSASDVVEYIDSFNIEVNPYGIDNSEYVGDD